LNESADKTFELSKALWRLVLTTLKPKSTETASECLNRLVRERVENKGLRVDEETATVAHELWSTTRLHELDRKHDRTNKENDRRPIVVVVHGDRKLLIDGNHRVNRWLREATIDDHEVLVITLRGR
jgi:hypothetical protein